MPKYVPFEKFAKLERRLRRIVGLGTDAQRRDGLAMILGLHGLRVTEVIELTVGSLDKLGELLSVKTLKRGKPRRVSLGPGVFKALKRLAAKRPADEPLFTTGTGKPVQASHWQRFARDVMRECFGGEGLNFHGLRHTFAMRLYHQTKDPQRVMARLGHKEPSSTQVYVEAYGELDDRQLERIGSIDVLPALAGSGHRAGGRRKKSRGADLTRSSLNKLPVEKRDIPRERARNPQNVRAKTRSGAEPSEKATCPPWPPLRIHRVKSLIEKTLAERAEELRREA